MCYMLAPSVDIVETESYVATMPPDEFARYIYTRPHRSVWCGRGGDSRHRVFRRGGLVELVAPGHGGARVLARRVGALESSGYLLVG